MSQETWLVELYLKVLFRSARSYVLVSLLEDKHLLPHELLTLPSSSQNFQQNAAKRRTALRENNVDHHVTVTPA
jgi:hypothetical protein